MKHFFIFLVLLGLSACQWGSKPLPQLNELPEFQLVDQSSRLFSKKDLKGKVWGVNFIFTSCAGTCPLLTERMKKVQQDLKTRAQPEELQHIGILSFSVDPERDTPEVLADYAKRYELDLQQWKLITGSVEDIQKTVVHGFKIAMGKVPRNDETKETSPAEFYDVVHGEKFLIVDDKGWIRGYYDANEAGMITFTRDLIALAKKDQ